MLSVETVKNALGQETGLKVQLGNAVLFWEYCGNHFNLTEKAGVVDTRFNPFAYRKMVEHTIDKLARGWTPSGRAAKMPVHKVHGWVVTKFAKLINWKIYPFWQQSIAQMNGQDMLLAKMLFIADIGGKHSGYGLNILEKANEFDAIQLREMRNHKAAALLAIRDADSFKKLADWRHYYALNQEVTPAVRETLDNFNHAIPFDILKNIRYINIQRPLTTKLEIVSNIAAYKKHRPLIQKADNKELKAALKKVGCDKLRSSFSVRSSASYMTELDDPVKTSVVDLAELRIKAGAGGGARNRWFCHGEENPYRVDDNVMLTRPPIEIPDIDNVRFLATVGELWELVDVIPGFTSQDVSKIMFGKDDFSGEPIFPFLVQYDGYMTVAKVHTDGFIEANMNNPAGNAAKNLLKDWAADLSEEDSAL